MVKKLLIALVGLILLVVTAVVVLVFSVEGDYRVEREVTINKPRAEVFAYVSQLKNQAVWGPWMKKDPAMTTEYRGTDSTVGFTHSWKSEKSDVGSGEQEIKRVVDGERMETQIRFIEPFATTSDAYITTESPDANQTRVKWGFTGSMPRPMNLMMLVMNMDKEVGKDFEEGLTNLKQILEK